MDPALLKQQLAFKQRAVKNVDMARKDAAPSTSYTTYNAEASRKKKRKAPSDPQLAAKSLSDFNYKTATSASNATNFGTMAKIVDYMKKRHLGLQHWSLKLSEILEELQVFDLNKKSEEWLKEALPQNPRLIVDEEGKFLFKPPYKVKSKNSLIALLKKCHYDGKGGILLSDLNECVANPEKHVENFEFLIGCHRKKVENRWSKNLADNVVPIKEKKIANKFKVLGNAVIDLTTLVNKRKDRVYFYAEPESDYIIDEAFKVLWRGASVDHLDEKKIEEYLQKHGIDVMKDLAPVRKAVAPPKRKAAKRRFNQKVHNEHLADVLEDYNSS